MVAHRRGYYVRPTAAVRGNSLVYIHHTPFSKPPHTAAWQTSRIKIPRFQSKFHKKTWMIRMPTHARIPHPPKILIVGVPDSFLSPVWYHIIPRDEPRKMPTDDRPTSNHTEDAKDMRHKTKNNNDRASKIIRCPKRSNIIWKICELKEGNPTATNTAQPAAAGAGLDTNTFHKNTALFYLFREGSTAQQKHHTHLFDVL